MGILAEIDALKAQYAKPAPAADPRTLLADQPSAFGRGLRAGVEDLTGQTRALLGQGAELVGANDTAAEQRALSLASQQEAARLMEGVPQSYTQVRGLRDAWDYGTGLLGRTAPGLVPMAAGAAVGGIPGMIAATAPSTIGAQFEAQQADPVQAAAPVGQRTLTGIAGGTGEAVVMGVVPGFMGNRLFGKAASAEATRAALPFGRAAAENIPEAVLGNAAAGNVSARIGQAAASSLNPQRDTSHDTEQQLEGTVSGAVVGVPFAAAGIAGAMRGKKAAAPKAEPVADAEAGAKAGAGRAAPGFEEQLAGLKAATQPELVTGREHADAAITGDETVESMAARDAAGEAEATAKARAKVDKLLGDPAAAHLHAELQQLDPGTTSGQQRIGELNVQHFTAQKRQQDLAADSATLDAALKTGPGEENEAFSHDYAGVDKKIYELMDQTIGDTSFETYPREAGMTPQSVTYARERGRPEWADFSPEEKRAAVANLRKAVELGERTGRIPRLKAQRDVFGTDPVARLTRIYKVLDSGDPKARERFFGALDRMGKEKKRDDGLVHAVRTALPDHLLDLPDSQVNAIVEGMKALSSENLSKTMGANELKVAKARIDDHLFDIFGAEQAHKLNEAFAQHAKEAETLVPADHEEAAKLKSAADAKVEPRDDADSDEVHVALGAATLGEDGQVLYEGERNKYYTRRTDAKNPSPFVLNNEAHAARYPHSDEVLGKTDRPSALREKLPPEQWAAYEKDRKARLEQAEAMRPQNVYMAKAHAENPEFDASGKPGHNVRWMSAREYADLHGMDPQRLDQLTGGRPDDYGLAVVRTRSADEHALDAADLKAMSIAKHVRYVDKATGEMKEKHLAAPDAWKEGESAIHVGEHVFDATRIASYMARTDGHGKGMAYTGADNEFGSAYRTARAFAEGVAALNIKLRRDMDDAQLQRALAEARGRGETPDPDKLRREIEQANDEKVGSPVKVGDDVVVVRAKDGQPAQTWGELQQILKDGGAKEQVRTEVHPLRQQRDALFENRAKARAQVERDNPDADLQALKALMDASDERFAEPIAAMNKKIAALRVKHELATESEVLHNERMAEIEGHKAALKRLDKAEMDQQERDGKAMDMGEAHAERIEKIEAKLASLTDFEIGGRQTRAEQLAALRAATAKATKSMDEFAQAGKGMAPAAERQAAAVEMRREASMVLRRLRADKADGPEAAIARERAEAALKLAAAFLTPEEKKALQAFRVHEKRLDRLQERLDQGTVSKVDVFKEMEGLHEVDAVTSQIQLAAAQHKARLGDVAAKMRRKANEYTELATPRDALPVTPERRWAALNTLADTLSTARSAPARAMGVKLRALIDNYGIMSRTHQQELGKLIEENGSAKNIAALAGTVNDLTTKYRTHERWSDSGAHAWTKTAAEGGAQHAAILKKVAKASDAPALHTALLELLADKNPNEHKAQVIDAMNARLGALMAKHPDDAYALQLKSAREAAGPLTPAQQAFVDKVAKGGLSAKAVVDNMAKSADVAALERAQRLLQRSDSANPHIDRALAAATERLAELAEPAEAKPQAAKPAEGVVVQESPASGYRERTQHNADSAGATVAIAVNFTTAGERLTRTVAGDKYFSIAYGSTAKKAGAALAKFMQDKQTSTLNIAGNGIYTLHAEKGLSQPEVNAYIHEIIAAAHAIHPITKIVSGGQTGVDIAGAVAARALGIPAEITLPKGFLQRGVDKVDRTYTKQAIEKQIADGARGLGESSDPPGTHYSLESTRVHDDLERPGFPAAHDSPLRHDGTFNWREHEGKGEGNATYGAGTYLSTAEEVHQSYKRMFTAQTTSVSVETRDLQLALAKASQAIAVLELQDKVIPRALIQAEDAARIAFEKSYKKDETRSPTYHVSVDIPREHLMSWDYLVSRQSAYVQEALARGAEMLDNPDEYPLPKGMQLHSFDGKPGDALRNRFGAEVYRDLADLLGSNRDASEYLQSLGIPGHEYASDGGADLDRPNYVIYDDSKIRTNYTELSREKQGTTASSAADQQAVHDYVNQVTGGDAQVNAAARLLYAGSYIEGGKDAAGVDYRPIINVSVHALNPLSTAAHESLHWLADHLRRYGKPEVFATLAKAADSPYVRNFLRSQFRDQPDALKQVEGSAEERVAYMYQFHRAGTLQLGTRAKTILDHIADLVNRVLGVWSNDARALHIMDYFGSGRYAEVVGADPKGGAAYAHKALMEAGRNKTLDRLHANFKPLLELGTAVAGAGSARIRDMGIPALTKIADLVRLHGTQEGADAGYLPAAGIARRSFGLQLVNAMGRDAGGRDVPFTLAQANAAFAAIALKQAPADAHQARLMGAMRSTMSAVHGYLRAAGVRVGERGLNADYTPRVWDPAFIAGHQDAFRTMIQKYIDSGEFTGSADALMARLMRDEGSELEPGVVGGPGDQHVKKRELHFITAEDAAPFVEKDALRVLTSYIAQATRRAEWSRRFEQMTPEEQVRYDAMTPYERRAFEIERVRPLDALKAAAVKQGATPDQLAVLDQYLLGVTGQLGMDVKPSTRKLFSQIMVYQNLRLLPLGFFSTLIDPVGVKVRGGTLGDVFNNFKRGILEIPRGFQEHPTRDAGYAFAEDLGVIDSAVLQHVMGNSYGLGAAGDKTRALNEAVFKWNLMDQMNTSQRVGATEAALRFLLRHKDGDASAHSLRYLGELGLKPADLKLVGRGADARIAVRQEDFRQLGFNSEAALAAHLQMRQAVNRWVDGAILRPDQSNKAIWMNDPLYALVAHMKQFSYAFSDTILKRVIHESRHGNYQPAVALAGYIPVMLAADLARGAVQSGGGQPDWKQGWDLMDYLANAIQRAGLFGVGQFALDMVKELRHGNFAGAVGALGGPTVSQLGQIVATAGGQRSLAATTIDAMPANALWSGYLPGSVTHPGHSVGHGGDTTAQFAPSEPMTIDE